MLYPCNYEASNLNVHASMQHAKNYTMLDESQHDSCFRTMYIRVHFKKLFTKKERCYSSMIYTIIIFKKKFFF